MSEIEDAEEVIDMLRGEKSWLNRGVSEADEKAAAASAQDAWDSFAKAHASIPADIKINYDDNTGFSLDTKSGRVSAAELREDITNSDYKQVFQKLGLKVDANSPDAEAFFKSAKQSWAAQPGVVDMTNLDDLKVSEESARSVGLKDPTEGAKTDADIEANIQRELQKMSAENRAVIDKALADLKKAIENPSGEETYGRWSKMSIKDIVGLLSKLGIASLTIVGLVKLVKEHQKRVNGCWLINLQTGEKCKIVQHTCDSGARQYSPCVVCADETKCEGQFDPCYLGSVRKANSTGPFPGAYDEKTSDPAKACSACSKCAVQCTKGTCSGDCTCSRMKCPVGYTMRCVNQGFWEAFPDLIKTTISYSKNIVKTIFTWIVRITIALMIGLLIWGLVRAFSSKEKGKDHTLNIKVNGK